MMFKLVFFYDLGVKLLQSVLKIQTETWLSVSHSSKRFNITSNNVFGSDYSLIRLFLLSILILNRIVCCGNRIFDTTVKFIILILQSWNWLLEDWVKFKLKSTLICTFKIGQWLFLVFEVVYRIFGHRRNSCLIYWFVYWSKRSKLHRLLRWDLKIRYYVSI
jgi:hypothetical protein